MQCTKYLPSQVMQQRIAFACRNRLQSLSDPRRFEVNQRVQRYIGRCTGCAMQAHAWTALGKLCLANEALAKACVPHFVRHLRVAASPAVRINIGIALADMCIMYTGTSTCCLVCGPRILYVCSVVVNVSHSTSCAY